MTETDHPSSLFLTSEAPAMSESTMMNEQMTDDDSNSIPPQSGPSVGRIFILAHPGIYVDGLRHILSESRDNEVVACVAPGDSCWLKFCQLQADVLLVHEQAIAKPMDDFFQRFIRQAPDIRILVFGGKLDDAAVFALLKAGAQGYIDDATTAEDFLEAILQVRSGQFWLKRRLLTELAKHALNMEKLIEDMIRQKIVDLGGSLSKKEMRVFEQVLEGRSTKEIADVLHMSEQSVKLYLGRIFKKFNVTNRSQLILLAFQKVCPVNNMIRLIRMTFDKQRLVAGKEALIPDPLKDM